MSERCFIFDIGNVLANFNHADLMLAARKVTGDDGLDAVPCDPELDDLVEKGLMSEDEYVAQLNRAKGMSLDVGSLTRIWSETFMLNQTGRGLFEQAVKAGVPVYTLSNISAFHIEAIRANWPGFFDGATGMFLSYRIGLRKPHPDIYRHLVQSIGVGPEQCFFIDDLPQNVETAKSLGINAHRFVPENHGAIKAAAADFFGLSWLEA